MEKNNGCFYFLGVHIRARSNLRQQEEGQHRVIHFHFLFKRETGSRWIGKSFENLNWQIFCFVS